MNTPHTIRLEKPVAMSIVWGRVSVENATRVYRSYVEYYNYDYRAFPILFTSALVSHTQYFHFSVITTI